MQTKYWSAEHLLVRYVIEQWVTWWPVVVAGQGAIETRYPSAELSLVEYIYLAVGEVPTYHCLRARCHMNMVSVSRVVFSAAYIYLAVGDVSTYHCLRARCHTRCCRFTARFMTTWKSRRSPFSPRTCAFTSSRTTQTQYCSSHRNPVW